jgi:monoamine oxidase
MYGVEGERVGNLFFAGEHCSLDYQGYMEGGCETGEAAALEILEDLGLQASAAQQKAELLKKGKLRRSSKQQFRPFQHRKSHAESSR